MALALTYRPLVAARRYHRPMGREIPASTFERGDDERRTWDEMGPGEQLSPDDIVPRPARGHLERGITRRGEYGELALDLGPPTSSVRG
jgi:hypothetical protein